MVLSLELSSLDRVRIEVGNSSDLLSGVHECCEINGWENALRISKVRVVLGRKDDSTRSVKK